MRGSFRALQALFLLAFLASGQEARKDGKAGIGDVLARPRVAGEFLVRWRDGAAEADRTASRNAVGAASKRVLRTRKHHLVTLAAGADEGAALKKLQADPNVLYAEPNYLYRHDAVPNDPSFGTLWGLHNTGQSGGTADADIDAPEAWDLTTGSSSVVVAVLDTGVDFSHPDLSGRQWVNPGEIPANGIDDDGNGFIDDLNGWDFFDGDADPTDTEGHGTHVAGTIGARGDNSVGVTGVAWDVRIIGLRFLGPTGGTTADAVDAYDYAVALKGAGVNLVAVNNSWGGGGYSQALKDAIDAAGAAGILSPCATGNDGTDIDLTPHYPSSYASNSIIAVAASDRNDTMALFSNYGAVGADLFAPGRSILSTIPTSVTSSIGTSGYDLYSGTSMATPHVTGVAALVAARFPGLSLYELRSRILYNVDRKDSLLGRAATCGRLNAHRALLDVDVDPPGDVTSLAASDPSFSAVQLSWSAPGDDGASGAPSAYGIRYSTSVITSGNFDAATPVECPPLPSASGSLETMRVCGLAGATTYYFALIAYDNVGNASALSNVASATTAASAAASTVFSDDFQGTGSALNAAKWVADSPWARVNLAGSKVAHDSPSGNYGMNLDVSMRSVDFSLAGMRDAILTFDHRYRIEEGYDFAFVEASADGGTSWTWLGQFSYSLASMTPMRICLHEFDDQPAVRIRFRLQTDDTVQYDGWHLDNVFVRAQPLSGNRAPVANPQTVAVTEDLAKGITLTGSDPDGDPITYAVVSAPSKGVLSGAAPNLTYTPNANATGADSFTFRVNDGALDSTPATVSVTIAPVNDPPTASPQSVSTPEDTAVGIALGASDPDGDPLTYTIVTGPTNGVLTGSGSSRTYTPNPNTAGPDGFTFKVSDGVVDSSTVTVSVTVTAVNDPPVADAQAVSTPEDTARAITVTGSDVEGSAVSFILVTGPASGLLGGTLPNVTYTPNGNFNGSDSFVFKVNDGTVDSPHATVSITVTAVNDPPVANAQSVSTAEDAAAGINLSGSDVDGNPLTYLIVTGPANGVLTGSGASRTYTPNAHFNGSDAFTFRVNDGTADSGAATVSITVTAVNDPPVADAQSLGTPEDTAKAIMLTGSDVEGDGLTYTVLSGPSQGSLSGVAPALTYTPSPGYSGPDSFTFKVNDGQADSLPAAVSIAVSGVNDAPTADAQAVTTDEDVPKAVTLSGTDPEADPLTFVVVSGPSNGVLTGSGASRSYTPNANFSGSDAFTFKVNDGQVDSPSATVTITVTAVNDPPVADAQSVSTAEDAPKPIVLAGSDVEGSGLAYAVVTGPSSGVLTGALPNVTYTPNADFNGADSFTFRVNDGTADSLPATVSITVTPVNDAPSATSQGVATAEDASVGIVLAGADPENDPLSFAIVMGPANGTLTGTLPNVTYTPNPNFNGPDSFTFRVSDAGATSAAATVSITITAVNDAPAAGAQAASTAEDTPVGLSLTGSDVEGSALTFILVSGPANGVLSGTLPSVTYTPNADFNGADSFTFKVNDGTADSPAATVSLTVTPVNDAPSAAAQAVGATEDLPQGVVLAGTDPESDPLTFAIVSPPSNGVLSGTLPNLVYTPNADFNGADAFSFRVNDGVLDSLPATVTVTVAAVNDAPVAKDQTLTLPRDSSRAVTLSGTDTEGDALGYTVLSSPSNGALTGVAPNLTYTPAPGYVGPDGFTFRVNDGTADSAPASVGITVSPDTTPPTVAITSPTATSTSVSTADLEGTSSDDIALDRIEWSNARTGDSGVATGLAAWTATIPLAEGANAITVTAFDTSGNSATALITITYTAPVAASGGGGGGGGCGLTGLEALVVFLFCRRRRDVNEIARQFR
jgi:subtilisin family serine protease